jgi:hypothetical protein
MARKQATEPARLGSAGEYARTMDARSAFDAYTARLVDAVANHGDVLGLVLAGSGAEPHRIDEWSDHDFFLVVSKEPEAWRQDLGWLPDADRVVLRPRETEHGLKVVYDDGHVLEFAVATPEEMRDWATNMTSVVLDRGGVTELVDGMIARTTAAGEQDADDIQLFLSHLLIGTGRARRGELLAANLSIRGHAMRHLLPVWRHRVEPQDATASDSLEPNRRFELAYPWSSMELADALAHDPEFAARELLDVAERVLADDWDDWPSDGVRAIRERLDWT